MKTLDQMSDVELLRDQADYLRQRSQHPDCLDPRVPIARAERLEKIAKKIESGEVKDSRDVEPATRLTTNSPAERLSPDEQRVDAPRVAMKSGQARR